MGEVVFQRKLGCSYHRQAGCTTGSNNSGAQQREQVRSRQLPVFFSLSVFSDGDAPLAHRKKLGFHRSETELGGGVFTKLLEVVLLGRVV